MFIPSFTSGVTVGGVLGLIAGAFCPSIMRKIKAIWVKDTQKVTGAVKTEAEKVAAKL